MRHPGFSLSAIAATVLAALLATAASHTARAALITDAPPATPGNAQGPAPFRYFGTGGSRVQQSYAATFFSNFAGPRDITEIDLRTYPGATAFLPFFGNTLDISDVTIRLSTTTHGDEGPNVLDTVFANNPGPDAQTVFSGPLSLTTLNAGTFDYRIVLQTPFAYNPSAGNLLLDVDVPTAATVSGNGFFGFETFDTVNTLNDGIYSIVNITDGAATSGVASTAGAITQFVSVPAATQVPEPASLALFAAGLGVIALLRRNPSMGGRYNLPRPTYP